MANNMNREQDNAERGEEKCERGKERRRVKQKRQYDCLGCKLSHHVIIKYAFKFKSVQPIKVFAPKHLLQV